MSTFVTDQITPLSADQAARAISEGYRIVTGIKPDKSILALLIGQAALETGNFQKMHKYNFGNVRGISPNGKWTSFRAGEIIDGKEVFYEAGDPKNKFRAYDTAIEGATDFVNVLKSRPHWWSGLQTKSVSGFVDGLTTFPAYFTANKDHYANVLQNRMANYTALASLYGAKAATGLIGGIIAAITSYFVVKKLRKS